MPTSLDARVAFASLVLVLATAVGETTFGGAGEPARENILEPIQGRLDSHALTLAGRALADLDPMRVRLVVNGVAPRAPLAATSADGSIALAFVEGGGSLDAARIELDDGSPLDSELRTLTPVDTLPGPRWGSALAQADGVAYVFGGAISPAGLAGQPLGDWQALDTILALDLATGGVRTLGARLPVPTVAASAVWDPRPSDACPAGCAYVLGGLADAAQKQDTIVRYDPASDNATLLDIRLPSPRYDAAAFWAGDAAYIVGGSMSPLRFDPVAQTVTPMPTNPIAFLYGARAVFDDRASPTCPEGCAYILGGRHAADIQPFTSALMQQSNVLRFDPATGTLAPTPARLPQGIEAASVAWGEDRAYVLGGRTCSIEGCARSTLVMVVDPATWMVGVLSTMEDPPEDAPAVWHEGAAVIVGGKTEGDDVGSTARVQRYAPEV